MFEEQILAEQNRVKSQIDKDTEYNFQNLTILLSSSIFYSNYVIAEIDYANYLLIRKLANEKYFTEESLSSPMSQNSISELLLNFSSLDNNKINSLIDEGVELYVNFSLRPITSISNFIFKGNETISKDEFLLKLAYFPNSNPIVKIFLEIIQDDISNIIIRSKLFAELYISIKEKFNSESKELILELIRAVNNMLKTIDSERLFLLALIIFFDNIHLYSLSEKLSSYLDTFEQFNIERFKLLLENDFAEDFDEDIIIDEDNESQDFSEYANEQNKNITISESELDSIEDEFSDFQQNIEEN